MGEDNVNIFNKRLRNKYFFISIKTHSRRNVKKILEREFNKSLSKRIKNSFKIVKFPDEEIYIYIISQLENYQNWEKFILSIFEEKNIDVEYINNFNLNPL